MAIYTIKDLENLSGIKAHTIRIWEKRYNIINPGRTETNIRTYDDQELKRLLNISILNNHGLKISHLAKMDPKEIQEKVLFVSQNVSDFDTQIEAIILSMLNLDEAQFNKIFNKSVMSNGFETTFEEIVVKVLDRIGVLWLTGAINPAQEHFISNLIRQKLISNIDSILLSKNDKNIKFTLFLPENEIHELGLLYDSYLIKKRGHEVLYFGQLTPLESVVDSDKLWKPNMIVISLIAPMADQALSYFLDSLSANLSNRKVILTGSFSAKIDLNSYSNILAFPIIGDFVKYLDSIS